MPGFIFYQGLSRIDNQPIVGIATYGSENPKTGNLIQTWIIRSDIHPINAINTGEDRSICGECPLRGRIGGVSERTKKTRIDTETVNKERGCYVAVQNAPAQIFRVFKSGSYEELSEECGKKIMDLGLRYGSYGDPVAIPLKYWNVLESYSRGKVRPGYTHQWRKVKFSFWSRRLMASTHSVEENEVAHSMGWRTFRTIASIEEKMGNEIICPASEEGGFSRTCETCGACNGRDGLNDKRNSVAIVVHGGDGKRGGALRVIERSKIPLSMV